MSIVYIGIGSNIEPRRSNLIQGIQSLKKSKAIELLDWSSLYLTKAISLEPQPDFFNAVIKIKTDLEPFALLEQLMEVEYQCGRIRITKNSPRPLDLDILLFDGQVIKKQGLTIPHPRMLGRGFVLVPLAQIAAKIIHPIAGKSIEALLALINQDGVSLLPGDKHWLDTTKET